MCVIKHSLLCRSIAVQAMLRVLYYATIYTPALSPTVSSGRPPIYSMFKVRCQDLVSWPYRTYFHTLRYYRLSTNSASRFLQASEYAFARANFSSISLRRSWSVSVCNRINSACFCVFLLSFSIITFLANKNPRVFSPGVLWSVVVYYYTTVLRDPWQISGVRSLLDSNQEVGIKPACLASCLQ